MFNTEADKLKMMGFEVVVNSDNFILAKTDNKVFIKNKAGVVYKNESQKIDVYDTGWFISIMVKESSRRVKTEVIIDSFGSIIDTNDGEIDMGRREAHFFENERHWLYRNGQELFYYDKMVEEKVRVIIPSNIYLEREKISIDGVTSMCIIVNEVYFNFKEKFVKKLVGMVETYDEITTVNRDEQGRCGELIYWIDNITGNMYRVTKEPYVVNRETVFYGESLIEPKGVEELTYDIF